MEQSKTDKSNTKPEMSIAETEFTEDEKARIDKFTERRKREPIKFKTDKLSSGQSALQVHEKDNVLGYAKMMDAFGTPDRQLQDHLLGQVIQTFCGSTTREGLAYGRLEEIGNKAMAL